MENKEKTKTRAQLAMDWLINKMPKDNIQNIGLNESYRMGLEDMVDWIDEPEI